MGPDVQVENAIAKSSFDALGTMTRIEGDTGDVTWSRHLIVKASHSFDFQMFPDQWQSISWRHGKTSTGSTRGVQMAEELSNREFEVQSVSQRSVAKHFPGWASKFEILESRVVLHRKMFPGVFVKICFPIALIVFISTITYGLPPTEYPARVALAITCVLTQVAFMDYITEFMPRVGYITWMDVYSLMSFAFNCFSLCEYGYIMSNGNPFDDNIHKQDEGDQWANDGTGDKIDEQCQKWVPRSYLFFLTVMFIVGLSNTCGEDLCPTAGIV